MESIKTLRKTKRKGDREAQKDKERESYIGQMFRYARVCTHMHAKQRLGNAEGIE